MQKFTPRTIGDKHVCDVTAEIRTYIDTQQLPAEDEIAAATACFIIKRHNDIVAVVNKFEVENSNVAPDLTLHKKNGESVTVNLYKIQNSGSIQPKNLGALSFIEKYFNSPFLQQEFNAYFKMVYRDFLLHSLDTLCETYDNDIEDREMREELRTICPRFTPEIEQYRAKFLYELREKCFDLFLKEYNKKSGAIEKAFNTLFMTDSLTIITRYNGDKLKSVEEFKVDIHEITNVSISKVGMNTVGITSDNITLLLRFKFESGPASSIKLATSYSKPKGEPKIIEENCRALHLFEKVSSQDVFSTSNKSDSNAIGKCSEAIFYSQILKVDRSVLQLDKSNFIEIFETYSSKITRNEFEDIMQTAIGTVHGLIQFLKERYGDYSIDSIELVPDAYLVNRLNTADIELVLRVGSKYVTEPISLKAIANASSSINCKNPGIGQILGPTYFNLSQEQLDIVLNTAKASFLKKEINHRKALEIISKNIGEQLINSEPKNIINGAQALLGTALVVVVYYRDKKYAFLEHDVTIRDITVHRDNPTLIQHTLSWSDGEQIGLRVKFSRGQRYGWSSVKLACAYKFPQNKIKTLKLT
ncbi:hypothetical protein [Vibrio parahaemolyticus]|uniref:hypothetical protein n=1 Tax=Vibrio parahaemolyticus TaxID=670 RepID=UPI001D169A8B|nr:hypothetical protein [Vibrio parahaemolyticus]MCC3815210.1 hypothetical protein [Vibrio parahaemolyticus]MCC3851863.1 hypothetical protein [Vibrio parahaemolyticus]